MAMDRLTGRRLFGSLAVLLAVGCGSSESNESEVAGALPGGANDAQAYTEACLADSPRAGLQLELLVGGHLEPDGDVDDTCPRRDGVDCLPYVFDEATLLTLSTENAPEELQRIVLRDGA